MCVYTYSVPVAQTVKHSNCTSRKESESESVYSQACGMDKLTKNSSMQYKSLCIKASTKCIDIKDLLWLKSGLVVQ